MVSYLIHYDILLKNTTDIKNCDSYFITKGDKSLSQNTSAFLLQNAKFLFQNAAVHRKCNDFIAKCDTCYKMRSFLQNASVDRSFFSYLPVLRYMSYYNHQSNLCHLYFYSLESSGNTRDRKREKQM